MTKVGTYNCRSQPGGPGVMPGSGASRGQVQPPENRTKIPISNCSAWLESYCTQWPESYCTQWPESYCTQWPFFSPRRPPSIVTAAPSLTPRPVMWPRTRSMSTAKLLSFSFFLFFPLVHVKKRKRHLLNYAGCVLLSI